MPPRHRQTKAVQRRWPAPAAQGLSSPRAPNIAVERIHKAPYQSPPLHAATRLTAPKPFRPEGQARAAWESGFPLLLGMMLRAQRASPLASQSRRTAKEVKARHPNDLGDAQ